MITRDVDGGNAVLELAAKIVGKDPLGLKRVGDEERVGRTVSLFTRAVRHVMAIDGGPTVRADVAPVATEIMGEAGDRFERIVGGDVLRSYEIHNVLPSGTREMRLLSSLVGFFDNGIYHVTLDHLRDPTLFRFISSAADRAKAAPAEMAVQAPDDIDGPAGDERIAFTIPDAAKALQSIVEAVDRFTRAWAAFSVEDGATFEQVDAAARELSELAGFKVPFVRQTAPIKTETPGLVHTYLDGLRMCGGFAGSQDIPAGEWIKSATCFQCRLACKAIPGCGQ